MNEDQYEIRFNLLVPKFVLFRYDVFPYLIAYAVLFYAYFNIEESDDSNLSIYLRLALIGVGFLNCKVLIYVRFDVYFRTLVQKDADFNTIQKTFRSL